MSDFICFEPTPLNGALPCANVLNEHYCFGKQVKLKLKRAKP